jgi:DNA topoisomerase III
MMRLFIAEKPSVGFAIAEELGIKSKKEGFIDCGNDVVTWCFGHLLSLAEPDYYTANDAPTNPKTGKKLWRIEDLPIIPEHWHILPKEDCKKQLQCIGQLIKEASIIVNAADADREGQLLVDEVLNYFKNTKPVVRFWVAAHDCLSLQRGLSDLKDNAAFQGLGQAALARSQADWLIGMNLSRAYTLNAAKSGNKALLTVGRVQTPTLKLVVDRDKEIKAFQSKPFYPIKGDFTYQAISFKADLKPSKNQEGLDEEDRLVDLEIANQIVDKVFNKPGLIQAYKKEPHIKQHPKAYSLSDLTLEASNRYGFSASDILEACQALYETHKLTTYPRTDCGYLPESQFLDAKGVLEALKVVNPELSHCIEKADVTIKSKTWDDKKVTVHYGIIPTQHQGSKENLKEIERKLYDLIVKRYIAQFYPLHEYQSTAIDIEVEGFTFIAKGKTITKNGWEDVYQEVEEEPKEGAQEERGQVLPNLTQGEKVHCDKATRLDAKTKPPALYTEGTLQRAMENIHKITPLEEHKKLLKEGDGIGTPATRASIIKELKNRKFLEAKGKYIISTTLGQSIVDCFPETVKSPVLTAMFERMLKTIEQSPDNFALFLDKQIDFVKEQVRVALDRKLNIKGQNTQTSLSNYDCSQCQKKLIRRKGEKGYWWSCSGYPNCTQSYKDSKGKPQYKTTKTQAKV